MRLLGKEKNSLINIDLDRGDIYEMLNFGLKDEGSLFAHYLERTTQSSYFFP